MRIFSLFCFFICHYLEISNGSTPEESEFNIFSELSSIVNRYGNERTKRSLEETGELQGLPSQAYSDYANESARFNNFTKSQNTSFECVASILADLHRKLQKHFPYLNDTGPLIKFEPTSFNKLDDKNWFSSFELNNFRTFCETYNVSRNYLKQCSDRYNNSITIRIAKDTLAIVEFMCFQRYSDVVSYFPCLKKNAPEVFKTCKSNCSKFALKDSKDSSGTISDNRDVFVVLDDSCKYVGCLIKCAAPLVEGKCKKGAKSLVLDAVRVIFSNLQDLVDTIFDFDWPKSCKDLVHI